MNKKLKEYLEDRDYILNNIEKLSMEDIKNYIDKWNLPMEITSMKNIKAVLKRDGTGFVYDDYIE